jgi:hypothetical protein
VLCGLVSESLACPDPTLPQRAGPDPYIFPQVADVATSATAGSALVRTAAANRGGRGQADAAPAAVVEDGVCNEMVKWARVLAQKFSGRGWRKQGVIRPAQLLQNYYGRSRKPNVYAAYRLVRVALLGAQSFGALWTPVAPPLGGGATARVRRIGSGPT